MPNPQCEQGERSEIGCTDGLKNGKVFLRQAKTKHSDWVALPSKVMKVLKACDEGGNASYFLRLGYWEGKNGDKRVAGSAIVGELALTPCLNLLPHRLEIP